MGTSTDRTHYREVLATLAQRTKARMPTLNGRVEKALKLALLGDVEVHDDGRATVYSSSDPTRRYELVEGTCTCRDWAQAPEHLCAHRLSAGFVRKVQHVLGGSMRASDTASDTMPPAPLPEAPASVNVHLQIAGRQVQLTLRDTDETRLLTRLQTVLAQYPPSPAQTARTAAGWCAVHQVQMQRNQKEGRSWFSHRTASGFCKGK